MKCPKCAELGKDYDLGWNGLGLPTFPMRYRHVCKHCSYYEIHDRAYLGEPQIFMAPDAPPKYKKDDEFFGVFPEPSNYIPIDERLETLEYQVKKLQCYVKLLWDNGNIPMHSMEELEKMLREL